jgi:hypothetical protein
MHENKAFFFVFFWGARSSLAHVTGLDPIGLTGSRAQASEPDGQNN